MMKVNQSQPTFHDGQSDFWQSYRVPQKYDKLQKRKSNKFGRPVFIDDHR